MFIMIRPPLCNMRRLLGRYYFVITTLDTDGRESMFSEEVSITI